jgi:hypothetical protein
MTGAARHTQGRLLADIGLHAQGFIHVWSSHARTCVGNVLAAAADMACWK